VGFEASSCQCRLHISQSIPLNREPEMTAKVPMRVKIFVSLKNGVLDPQGKAVEQSLHTLGYKEVQDVRVGKFVELNLQAGSREVAEERIREMCDRLLANPVIENFQYEISEG
jgi:phosphoribosylformylglycinamidine synthase PurS subunit